MAVKAPRGLTHARRLRDPQVWAERIAPGLEALGDRFSVLLAQLPPDLERDDALLDAFLASLPAWVPVAVELRHPSWQVEEVFGLLASRGAAYVVMSGAHLPCVLRATAPFVYVRLHGPSAEHLYAGSYPDPDLDWWADRFREWTASGLDVYGYFNNDGGGNAVRDAQGLRSRLG
jgi:uncharacterized protein YecE (DUF72 family)